MKPSNTVSKAAYVLSGLVALILVLLPFHAFLTVWLSSGLGHYTLLRLWKEILLIPVFIGTIYILAVHDELRRQFFRSWLVRLIAIYTLLVFLAGAISFARHDVNSKALAYGILLDLRFLFFFLMVLVICACWPPLSSNWRRLLLWPSVVVVVFAVLQYWFLPYNFLSHFGYGPNTISPYETINHDIQHLRVASTLRGANPLGAYLVLIISAVIALWASAKQRRWRYYLLGAVSLLALIYSYSRSAWIGAFISLVIILWLSLKTPRLKRWLVLSGLVIVVIGAALAVALRHNITFEDDFLHTSSQSQIKATSDQGHSAAFKSAVHDIVHQPQGRGPGTAGPASVYNDHPARIAEDYFLQIGQEMGVIGMALFIAINIMMGRMLWLRRDEPLALALLASLVGLSFVNLLSFAWADDTLAYIWWGLAAIALSPAILKTNTPSKNGKTKQKPA